jgi:glutaredoxin-like YruB-family protein
MAVVVYSTPTCSYCNKVKEFLRQKRVSFTDYNVAQDMRRADEMVKKSGQMGVPVVDINGKIIVGFNQPEIENALKR